jgi:hypothetical protein
VTLDLKKSIILYGVTSLNAVNLTIVFIHLHLGLPSSRFLNKNLHFLSERIFFLCVLPIVLVSIECYVSEVGSASETRYSDGNEVMNKFQINDNSTSLSHAPSSKPYIAELAHCACHIIDPAMCAIFVAT